MNIYGTPKTALSVTVAGHTFRRGEETPLDYATAMSLQDHPRLDIVIPPAAHAAAHTAEHAEASGDAADDASTGPQKPTSEAQLFNAILDAVDQLDPDNEAHYTNAGMPDARALSTILGWTVTAAERNAAMESASRKEPTPVAADAAKGGVKITRREAIDPTTEGAVKV